MYAEHRFKSVRKGVDPRVTVCTRACLYVPVCTRSYRCKFFRNVVQPCVLVCKCSYRSGRVLNGVYTWVPFRTDVDVHVCLPMFTRVHRYLCVFNGGFQRVRMHALAVMRAPVCARLHRGGRVCNSVYAGVPVCTHTYGCGRVRNRA